MSIKTKIYKMRVIFFLFLGHASLAVGQSFEGIITWTLTSEVTDAQQLIELKKNQDRMSTAEFESKRQVLLEILKQPEYSDNPELKEHAESILKVIESRGHVDFMIPTGFIIKLKEGKSNQKSVGGIFSGLESLSIPGNDTTFMLNRAKKIFFSGPMAKPVETLEKPVITKTAETTKLLGYTCAKYVVKTKINNKPLTQIFWITTAIKNLSVKDFRAGDASADLLKYIEKEVPGFPLKVEVINRERKLTFEVKRIQPILLPAEDFIIPADFSRIWIY